MFCSTCGKQINENLNFCNNCGARIDSGNVENQSNSYSLISTAIIGLLSVIELFGFVFLAVKLIEKNLDPSFVFVLLALYTAAVLGISFLVFKQTSNQNFKPRRKEKTNEKSAPEKLPGVSTAQLNAPSFQTSAASVTENTTRTLDEVLIERK